MIAACTRPGSQDAPHDAQRRRWLLGLGALAVGGCASTPPDADEPERLSQSPWARATLLDGVSPSGPWVHRRYGNRRPTQYRAVERDGRPALYALSESGNSTLRLPLRPHPLPPGARLRFSWWVPALLPHADLQSAEADDAVARVILTFDGDRASWSRRDHMLSELAQLVTGEPMPYATLMYVWDDRYPVGSVILTPTRGASASWWCSAAPRAWGAGWNTNATCGPTTRPLSARRRAPSPAWAS